MRSPSTKSGRVQSQVSAARTPARATQASGEVRLIGGHWKRIKLKVADKPGLRPTPDRVRETLFNWLGQDLSGWVCVDAFAGSGALGLEAASRGAREVLLVEHDGAVAVQLQRVVTHLQSLQLPASVQPCVLRVQRGDGLSVLRQLAPASQDLVFLDPPFDGQLFDAALQLASRAVAARGFVYLEAPTAWADAQLAALGFGLHRHLKAGAVHAHLLQRLHTVQTAASATA